MAESDLSLTKNVTLTTDADGRGSINAGDTVTFTITVSNAGPNDASGVNIRKP
jgi:subtilase family serine protease